MWPHIKFDPLKLFNLQIGDLIFQDPYYVRLTIEGEYQKLGDDLFIGFLNVPDVVDYFCTVCPEKAEWLRKGISRLSPQESERIKKAETRVLNASCPWNLGMVKSPAIWDALPWGYWNPSIIYDKVELKDKIVLDVGAGTGQVSIRCAPFAKLIYALEPVGRLRQYIKQKMSAAGFKNVQTLNGLLEAIPLEIDSIDISILSSGSFGWNPDAELEELERVTKAEGTILMLAPCNFDNKELLSKIKRRGGYDTFDFEIPCDGKKPAFIKRLS